MTLPDPAASPERAARLAAWPELGAAWRAGRLTGAQVDLACAARARPPRRALRRDDRPTRSRSWLRSPPTRPGVVLRHWVQRRRRLGRARGGRGRHRAGRGRARAGAVGVPQLDDELAVRGSFDTDSAAPIEKALDAATRDDAPRRAPHPEAAPGRRAGRGVPGLPRLAREPRRQPPHRAAHHHRRRRGPLPGVAAGRRRRHRRRARAVPRRPARAGRARPGPVPRGLRRRRQRRHHARRPPRHRRLLAAVAAGGDGAAAHRRRPAAEPGPLDPHLHRRPAPGHPRPRQGCRAAAPTRRGATSTTSCRGRTAASPTSTTPSPCAAAATGCSTAGGGPNRIDPDGTYTLVLEDGTERTTRPPGLDAQLPRLPVATSSEPARVPGRRRRHQPAPLRLPVRRAPQPRRRSRVPTHPANRPRTSRRELGLGA